MTIDVKTKTIGGLKFELAQLPAFTAFEGFHRFLAIAGPLFPVLVVAFKAQLAKSGPAGISAELREQLFEGLVNQLPAALAKASPVEVRELSRLMLEPCTVLGKERVSFNEVGDELLRGKLGTYLQLLAWAVGVHFGSFFSELGALTAPSAAAPAPSSSSSPTT